MNFVRGAEVEIDTATPGGRRRPMIDPVETLIPLAQVPKHLPPPLDRTHASTVTRWALRGVGRPPVRLTTVKVGGRRYVRPEALIAFIAALSAGPAAACPSAPSATRARAMRQADQELDAAGI